MAKFSKLKKSFSIQAEKPFVHDDMYLQYLPPPEDVYNIDDFVHPETGLNHRHYAVPTGDSIEYFPSATNVLGKIASMFGEDDWLDQWRNRVGHEEADRISRNALIRGTFMHDYAEAYLLNKQVNNTHALAWSLFSQIKPELDKIEIVYCLEHALYSKMLQIAGRVDCIGHYEGCLQIVDFKSSRKMKTIDQIPGYIRQICMYSFCFKELTGQIIEFASILMGIDEDPRNEMRPGKEVFDIAIADTMETMLSEVYAWREHINLPLNYTPEQMTEFYFEPGLRGLHLDQNSI